MQTQCTSTQLEFQGLGHRKVLASFDGGYISSDGGALLLREMDRRLALSARLAACFTDYRSPARIEHRVEELLRQRIYGIALGYEDLNDHDDLMGDPLLALALGKEAPEGQDRRRKGDKGKALASSSTLNRLELTPADAGAEDRYKKVVYHPERIEKLLVDVFLDSFRKAPEELVLDFDATDDPIHGTQEGRFFHGYYRCYCYLPLYVTCGEHLLAAKLRTSGCDGAEGSVALLSFVAARIRARFPKTRIILRGDSGFARDDIMDWCEDNRVGYLLGMAKNKRLLAKLGKELAQARALHKKTGQAARVFTHFHYRTRKSWSRSRRVIGKAEHLDKGSNPRFIVTNLPERYATPKRLYEIHYCARGDMENRIKEQQLDLFADRTSSHTMRANQLRLWFSSFAYVLLSAVRRVALKGTRLAKATCGTIRLKILKIGAQVNISVRRVLIHLASACPYQDVFQQAWHNVQQYPSRC